MSLNEKATHICGCLSFLKTVKGMREWSLHHYLSNVVLQKNGILILVESKHVLLFTPIKLLDSCTIDCLQISTKSSFLPTSSVCILFIFITYISPKYTIFDLLTFYFNEANVMIGWSMLCIAQFICFDCSIDCLKSQSWYF